MGLDDFTGGSTGKSKHKCYNYHKLDEQLESIVDDLQDRFPEEVKVDFIEASPRLKSYYGKAFKRFDENGLPVQYIRIKKSLAEQNDELTEAVIAHEMAHIFLYQNGFTDVTEKDVLFQWVCGRVKADPTDIYKGSRKWRDVIKPFMEM